MVEDRGFGFFSGLEISLTWVTIEVFLPNPKLGRRPNVELGTLENPPELGTLPKPNVAADDVRDTPPECMHPSHCLICQPTIRLQVLGSRGALQRPPARHQRRPLGGSRPPRRPSGGSRRMLVVKGVKTLISVWEAGVISVPTFPSWTMLRASDTHVTPPTPEHISNMRLQARFKLQCLVTWDSDRACCL